MIFSILLGFLLGVIQIGSVTLRTIQVLKGQYIKIWLTSVVITLSYYFGMMFIINKDIPGFISFGIGAATITSWMAWKNAYYDSLNKR